MYLSELNRNAKSLDVDKLFEEAVKENKEYIIDLNTSQLEKGKDSNAETINPYYKSAKYADWKKAMGSEAPLGVPNLKVTGDFYGGFTVDTDVDGLFIKSTDSKSDKLKGIYGEDIFGLDDVSKADLKTMLLPTFLTKIKNGLLRK